MKRVAVVVLLAGLGLCLYGLSYLYRVGPIPAGFAAQAVCAGVFISGRDADDVYVHDIMAMQRRLVDFEVREQVVTATFGFWPITAVKQSVYRPGLGCARLGGGSVADLEGPESLVRELPESRRAWPELVSESEGVDSAAIRAALDRAFTDDAIEYEQRQNTRAVVIFHKGQLIAERYADGFGPDVPLDSWSMSKSATSALVGILVGRGQLDLSDKTGLKGWDTPGDLRSEVTIGHLLHMTSGLEFNEGYEEDPISDVTFMLMTAKDLPEFAVQYPITAKPGTRWAYQTASPVLLGRVIRDSFESDDEYNRFPQTALFNKIGMYNAHYQMDGGGTYVGGAMLFATARDWARFGLMYLNDGIVNGERILPEGWVELSTTPTDASMKARAYAAQFWLNQESAEQMMPSIPKDAYAARGHYGQSTFIIPSRDLVVVRMGQSFGTTAWNMEAFLFDILAALEG
ncbi:class C beta-lactamase-related serine hydrolase [Halioglobus maricola]|uniref:Class C beta-lactamase-related serine hydrolase n=1 Tax=Halioglobus maricola TaxID=2601894 RepID=A0A5P9NFZ0_9GAMM|nr:serine hydrolase [Halioglobus maricola]QFU74439.1 class C beta-lactamase-related serine hydrolase [Halioglobus maricola]